MCVNRASFGRGKRSFRFVRPVRLLVHFLHILDKKNEEEKEKHTAKHCPTSILIGDLAKLLQQNGVQMGQNRLFEWMRRNGYLIGRHGSNRNMPTQRAMEMGLFVVKETAVTHSDGHVSVSKTPKVTGKGQVYFINKFKPA